MTPIQRFNAKVNRNHPSGCAIWTGAKNKKGYGRFFYKGRNRRAHTVSWEFSNGPIPAGKKVCHDCDNRACVDENHLFLGTTADNNRDMHEKGRANCPRGETHPNAKLTAADVAVVRSSDLSTSQLAKRFGVTYKAIDFIRKGVSWRANL